MSGVGKTTGFVLKAVIATLAKSQAVLLVAPTTTARTQLFSNGLLFAAPELEEQIRVLVAQKLSDQEKTHELEQLLRQRLLPTAQRVAP